MLASASEDCPSTHSPWPLFWVSQLDLFHHSSTSLLILLFIQYKKVLGKVQNHCYGKRKLDLLTQ
jgi:hypothetical protein